MDVSLGQSLTEHSPWQNASLSASTCLEKLFMASKGDYYYHLHTTQIDDLVIICLLRWFMGTLEALLEHVLLRVDRVMEKNRLRQCHVFS